MKYIKNIARTAIVFSSIYILNGCQEHARVIDKDSQVDSLGNPAVKKCLDDGYDILPITTNGLPSGNLCVDAENKCEVWSFYRGDCLL